MYHIWWAARSIPI